VLLRAIEFTSRLSLGNGIFVGEHALKLLDCLFSHDFCYSFTPKLSLVSRFIPSAFYYPKDGALRDVFGGKVI
jgi:hypothetical protein